jgi:hypothetical protein
VTELAGHHRAILSIDQQFALRIAVGWLGEEFPGVYESAVSVTTLGRA